MGQRIIEVRTRVTTGPTWQSSTLAEHTITAPLDTDTERLAYAVRSAVESLVADTNMLHGHEPEPEPAETTGEFHEV